MRCATGGSTSPIRRCGRTSDCSIELYGRALQDDALRHPFLDGIVEDWLAPATEINVAYGLPPELARAHARLGIAAIRGLLLDLLATRDVAGVDAAMEAFIDVYEAWLERAARLVKPRAGAPGAPGA